MINDTNYLWEAKEFYEFGFVNKQINPSYHVSQKSLKSDVNYKEDEDCSSNFNKTKFNQTMHDQCLGENTCELDITQLIIKNDSINCGLDATFFV